MSKTAVVEAAGAIHSAPNYAALWRLLHRIDPDHLWNYAGPQGRVSLMRGGQVVTTGSFSDIKDRLAEHYRYSF